jgi:SAM-dependent methyltransferase
MKSGLQPEKILRSIGRKYSYYLGKIRYNPLYAKLRKHYLKEKGLETYFLRKRGLEIGGPSQIFTSKGILPIYSLMASLDGCNFTDNTVWEGNISSGPYLEKEGNTGRQYISEGSSLAFAADDSYDFLLSSHSLEHHANVIKALKEWKRAVKPGGLLLVVVPDKNHTFDHKREFTAFEHFLEDEAAGVDEADLTHLDEILRLHDLSMDPGGGDFERFKQRSLENYKNRCLHQHVFNFDNLGRLAAYLQLEVLETIFVPPYHNMVFLRKGFTSV